MALEEAFVVVNEREGARGSRRRSGSTQVNADGAVRCSGEDDTQWLPAAR